MMDYPVLDFSAAMDRVDNDTVLYFELIDMFFSDYDSTMVKLEQAVVTSDCAEIEAVSHAIKSALGNLGGMAAYQAAYELELAGSSARKDALEEAFKIFQTSVAEFKIAVDRKRNG